MTKFEVEKEILYFLKMFKDNLGDDSPLNKYMRRMTKQSFLDFIKDNETTVNSLPADFMHSLMESINFLVEESKK